MLITQHSTIHLINYSYSYFLVIPLKKIIFQKQNAIEYENILNIFNLVFKRNILNFV